MIDLTGTFQSIQIDYLTRKPVISLLINEDPGDISSLREMPLAIKIGRLTKKRSLDANAYFHVLVDKIRQKRNISFAECKNDLITSYGQVWYLEDGKPFTYKTNADPDYIKQREEIHLKFVCATDDGAYMYRAYRGSHTYDSQEMAVLIAGTVQEARMEGIETATPDELERMAAQWGINHG